MSVLFPSSLSAWVQGGRAPPCWGLGQRPKKIHGAIATPCFQRGNPKEDSPRPRSKLSSAGDKSSLEKNLKTF